VEEIMEDKLTPQKEPNTTQAPLVEELKKETPSVKALAYHHTDHPIRLQPARKQLASWDRISNNVGGTWRKHGELW